MKKLYIKQKVFSWVDRFTVKDEAERDRYQVRGDFVVIGGKKLHIEDMAGNEVALVKEKFLTLLPKFFVFVNDTQVAEIQKKFTFFKAKYEIKGPEWKVNGSIMDHDYSITDRGKEIVNLHKAWLSWGDSYEINIADGVDEIMVLSVVLAIDCVQAAQAAASAASSSSSNSD